VARYSVSLRLRNVGLDCILASDTANESLITRWTRNQMVLQFCRRNRSRICYDRSSEMHFSRMRPLSAAERRSRRYAAASIPIEAVQLEGRGPAGGNDAARAIRGATTIR